MHTDQKAHLRLNSRDSSGETVVSDWQRTLARLGYPPGPSDGVFGARTERATKDMQRAAGVKADGIVGPETRAAARLAAEPVLDVKPDNIIEAIDVSAHQGEIEWHAVARAGKKAAWIKATEGRTLIDQRFAANWFGARAAGLLVGAYHFLTVTSSAEDQARAFLRVLPAGGTLPPVIDVERGIKGGTPRAAAVLAFARVLEEGLRARGGELYTKPWIYTGPAYALACLQGAPAIGDYGLWVAHYGVTSPTVPPPWTGWDAWQATGDGRCDGIEGPVDIDVIRLEALNTA